MNIYLKKHIKVLLLGRQRAPKGLKGHFVAVAAFKATMWPAHYINIYNKKNVKNVKNRNTKIN